MAVQYKRGDLLSSTDDYIVHQCNCVTKGSLGLATQIFKKYPYSNTYKYRKSHSTPGTIDILGNGKDKRYVINMYSQYYPGPSKYTSDNTIARLEWFKGCLYRIGTEINGRQGVTISFPYLIGCGLAGGEWSDYLKEIESFSEKYNVIITLYRLD